MITEKGNGNNEEQEWENPLDPEAPADSRDKEQVERQYQEAKRRKENLTETDHLDHPKKESK
ncbi:hypothetical protein MUY27_11605 [Mucilaginibacter sp. RS28]|uniref:Uncharacterized protein n=1 Tax=Mucilaginibacter straminoryzae TaxID=2932774 RepID=A0A9X1X5C3_9SPHI|nr:hypothetical protein [Mucilaginibacter straminoryzae]MCJ8210355.1 hypothetical protein [Mucilaginibacter straminoryzae]